MWTKIFFEVLRDRLSKKENMSLIAKYLAEDIRHYWLLTDFDTKLNNSGDIIAHYNRSTVAPSYAVHKISSIYKILSKIEAKTGNTKTSERYLIGFLEERNMTYNDFIEYLTASRPEYENKVINQPEVTQRSQSAFQNQNANSSGDLLHTNLEFQTPEREMPGNKKSLFQRIFGKA